MRFLASLFAYLSFSLCALGQFSVINQDSSFIQVKTPERIYKEHYHSITISSEKHQKHGHVYIYEDGNTDVKEAVVIVRDQENTVIKKYELSDFTHYGLSKGTEVRDDHVYALEPNPGFYPFKVEYSYKVKSSGSFSLFRYKENHYNQILTNASVVVEMPADYGFKCKSNLFDSSSVADGRHGRIYHWNLSAPYLGGNYESHSPRPNTNIPLLEIVPDRFSLYGYDGSFENWRELGQWSYNFLQEAKPLPEKVQAEIRDQFGGIADPYQRAKAVYQWMQDRSRYISIQLGIGGWKPMDPSDVHKKGFGDCKALSFYTREALKAVDIEAHYALVFSERKYDPVDPQFCASRFNHVILQLPFERDTCWLECTSKVTPFDFAGRSTADHHALVIKDKASYLTRVKNYQMDESLISQSSQLKLDGEQTSSAHTIEFGKLDYDAYLRLTRLGEKDLSEWMAGRLLGSNPQVEKITVEKNDSLRTVVLQATVNESEGFSKLGNYLVVNPLRLKSDLPLLPEDAHREKPISFPFAMMEKTSVIIAIPEGYKLKSLPQPHAEKNEFGSYKLNYDEKAKSIVVSYSCHLKKQELPANRYDEIRDFLQALRTVVEQKVVFTPA